jgi:hypothetical protein
MNLTNRIKKLYEEHPIAIERFKRNLIYDDKNKFNDSSIILQKRVRINLEKLERYNSKNRNDAHLLNLASAQLPGSVLIDQFGEAFALWTLFNTSSELIFNRLTEEVCGEMGLAPQLIHNSDLAQWRTFHDITKGANTILQIYELFESLKTDQLDQDQFREHLRNYRTVKKPLSENKLQKYSLRILQTEDGVGAHGDEKDFGNDICEKTMKKYNIWLDAPLALGLMFNEEPQAVVGFIPYSKDTLMINQIQGVHATKFDDKYEYIGERGARGLFSLNWIDALIDYTVKVALDHDYENLCIQSAKNNKWIEHVKRDGSIPLDHKKALKVYDKTASRLGFVQREDKNWYRLLEEQMLSETA